MYTTVLATDLCPDCLTKAQTKQRQDFAKEFTRRTFAPTWREKLNDIWVGHIEYHWLVWFGDFTDTYNWEQRLAQRLPWNKDRFVLTEKEKSRLKVLNEIRLRAIREHIDVKD